jgi:hypothetical protein
VGVHKDAYHCVDLLAVCFLTFLCAMLGACHWRVRIDSLVVDTASLQLPSRPSWLEVPLATAARKGWLTGRLT